jgi:hypothetical protein
MTKIIAVLIVLGQFEVAVETSKGYFVASYPDTEIGVADFLNEIRQALDPEPGRFYPCVVYDGPTRDLLQSPLAARIGVAESLRTGLRDPGIADAPWIVRDDRMKGYLAGQPVKTLNAKLVEKMCLSFLPHTYIQLYPTTTKAKEFYRPPAAE